MELQPLAETPPVRIDPTKLDRHTDDDLDLAPYGIIGLDAAGRILRYNLAEARFARLDRNTVLGRRFFGEVAPCTARPEFEGRFRAFVAGKAPTERFGFVFDFKFGAQEVEIELVRGEAGRFWVLVNRRKFSAPRKDAFRPAPTQRELQPGDAGVARDASEQRAVTVSPAFFAAMRSTWDRVAPKGWAVFSSEWGLKWGRLAVVDLETQALEQHQKTLRELPMRTVMAMVADYLGRQGWGRMTTDFAPARHGVFVITLERGALAESIGFSEVPRCELFGGFFRALFSHLADRLLAVREVCCAAQGLGKCAFVVASASRRGQLEQAVARSDGDVSAVVAALAGAADA